ncbi:MAG: response regulator [Candidatus Riflebacteria bacterium]|nr:response regulator [Candidatus Riflebacteria bacterium]
MKKIKVLIVDDSRIMRKLISGVLEADERVEVVGQAEHGVECLEKVVQLQPDVVTLDLNMPVMDGLTVLRESKARNLATTYLVVSSLAKRDAQITLDAITEGAIDFILKPSQAFNIGQMGREIIEKILIASVNAKKMAAQPAETSGAPDASPAPVAETPAAGTPVAPAGTGTAPSATSRLASLSSTQLAEAAARMMQQRQQTAAAAAAGATPEKPAFPKADLTVIGGSSGSIQTLVKIVPFLPAAFGSAVVIVLHLPPFFTTQFTLQLSHKCPIPVQEAADGMTFEPRKVYLAPGGDKNVIMRRQDDGTVAFKLIENDANSMYTPSIDILMSSVAEIYKGKCRGILISGTGNDGVEGLRSIRNGGGGTFVQDKATAIANQLPFAALKAGVVDKTLSIQDILVMLSA